jgi:predicted DNA-binding protein
MAKYTIDLGEYANKQLDEVAKEKGMTKADVIRRAVATYVTVNREIKNGNRLTISNSEDRIIKELVTL